MEILEDFVDFPTFAKQLSRCETTIERWTKKPDGLPYTKVGNRRLIHVPTAREWLMGRWANLWISYKTTTCDKWL